MKTNTANAKWEGDLKNGRGSMNLPSINQQVKFGFSTRFENEHGTNPEELIGAAHAGCFSMAFSMLLSEQGYIPDLISTKAEVKLVQSDGGYVISQVELISEVKVPGINEEDFKQIALEAKENCPVSQALSGVKINLKADIVE